MNIADVPKVLDKSWRIRQVGKNQIVCLSGHSGIGKSQIVHQWVNKMRETIPDFRMIDRRCALLDPTDFQGLPWKNEDLNITQFLPPEFLPREKSGVFFLDEINRGTQAVMNVLMQLFTERKIGEYTLPEGWIILTAINPPDSTYDVNVMEEALKNRVIIYDVKYDHKTLLKYAKQKEWTSTVNAYLASGQWVYKEPGQGDEFYISPRSWEYLSDDEYAGSKDDPNMHYESCIALLGKNIGSDYWNFCHKTKPVFYKDIEEEFKSVAKLNADRIPKMKTFLEFEKYANPALASSYRADLISATFQSILDAGKNVNFRLLIEIANVMPVDQIAALFHAMSFKFDDPAGWLMDMKCKFPDIFAKIRKVATKTNTEDDDAEE